LRGEELRTRPSPSFLIRARIGNPIRALTILGCMSQASTPAAELAMTPFRDAWDWVIVCSMLWIFPYAALTMRARSWMTR